MRKLYDSQSGFIPMIICLVVLVVAVLYVSYHVVAKAQR
jgi:amino acid transporter